MTWKYCKECIIADNARISALGGGNNWLRILLRAFFGQNFPVIFWFRIGTYLESKKNFFSRIFLFIVSAIHKHYQYSRGIELKIGTKVGKGLRFCHFSGITIAKSVVIGEYCSIHQGVTLGESYSPKSFGKATLGDHVVIFAGAKVCGKITLGDYSAVGANSVVTHDVPSNCLVAGMPAKIIKEDTSDMFYGIFKKEFARE